jgi:hypothetical protein
MVRDVVEIRSFPFPCTRALRAELLQGVQPRIACRLRLSSKFMAICNCIVQLLSSRNTPCRDDVLINRFRLSPDSIHLLALSNWNTALADMFAVGWSPPRDDNTGFNTSKLCMRSSALTENVPSDRGRAARSTMRRCDRSAAATTSGPRLLHDRVPTARVHVGTAWYTGCTVVLESNIDYTWCTLGESCTHVCSMYIPAPTCNPIYTHLGLPTCHDTRHVYSAL